MSSITEPTPCAQDPDGWNSSAAEAEIAARLCLDCPAMPACLTYARAAGETEGVWGGTTPRERRKQ
ncbi:WhiB family transcriptional regulator [Brachybacterium sp. p3-SID957]|uniref:WhiB family transcriptional regulator n=1 Tax=Brachybacterium sp. p3-SID957 TaxID=2916049 RepID=UPI00223B6B0B|nr:WhiB family transcriptional regulator [Brachybacterium sp. p3-SID957]